jgi:hypothetical protein
LLPVNDNSDDSSDPGDKAGQFEPVLPLPCALPQEPSTETDAPADQLPPTVRAFWDHQEPITPPWRLESAADREQDEEFEKAGVRWL